MTIDSLDLRPLRSPGLDVAERDGDVVLTDAGGRVHYLLNETARAIWDNCDGKTTVRELLAAAQRLFAAPPELLESDVMTLLAELRVRGLIVDAR